jgi:hypothetical protein
VPSERPILIATRGSALALAQSNNVLAQCRAAFPRLKFDLKIIKTTGDKLQTASLAKEGESLPKGLFTKVPRRSVPGRRGRKPDRCGLDPGPVRAPRFQCQAGDQ